MKTALITGSETFGRYITNPTKWLALSAEGRILADHKIYSLIFPSIVGLPKDTEDPGSVIIKKAVEINAKVIISFGMASEVKGFRIERSATNWIYNEKYCSADENNRPLNPTRPAKEQLQIDLTKWDIEKVRKLFAKAHIPFDQKISDNPGQYSCNSWIYRTILARKKYIIKTPYIFVHTACTPASVALISDFLPKKVLIKNNDLLIALEIFLRSYYT